MKILCVSEEIAKYVPIVVKLCYAIAGVVAIVGAISVYISMNNEEQDVKNILVLKFREICKRKEGQIKALKHSILDEFLNFDFVSQPILKNI